MNGAPLFCSFVRSGTSWVDSMKTSNEISGRSQPWKKKKQKTGTYGEESRVDEELTFTNFIRCGCSRRATHSVLVVRSAEDHCRSHQVLG
ncbi:hypothetical protein OUZ56_020021 [Daphnia magna]|uniref:Uncharacterized protein n=1 Tax=Daphnia magna TaxID=35525 RepID=A0ABQ9ZE16_9CRUS|nr:hypothetical protein OUZ56_020021 [Daphnia magna]